MSELDPAFRRAGLVGILALGLDQLTKAFVRAEVEPGEPVDLILGLKLKLVSNEGIAFGLLDDLGGAVIALGAVGFLILLAYFLASGDRTRLWLPVGLLAGGALGNLVDRVREGFVTDFIDLPWWPTFNVADIEITLGVALIILVYLRELDPGADEPDPAGG